MPSAPQSSAASTPSHIHDILVIGAGPAGMALAARLQHSAAQHGTPPTNMNSSSSASLVGGYDTLFLDAEGSDWLVRWRRLFKAYEVPWLRSPMFFHLDPSDRNSLSHWMAASGRDIPENKRPIIGYKPTLVEDEDRHNYFTPTGDMFDLHCDHVLDKFGLVGRRLVRQDVVRDVAFDAAAGVFTVAADGGVYRARCVVDATGPGGLPSHPDQAMVRHHWPSEGVTHAYVLDVHETLPTASIRAKIARGEHTSITIVGGGLTAVEIVDMAIKRGVGHVHHVVKDLSHTVKPFDNEMEWIGKYRDRQMATFTAGSVGERVDLMHSARRGGSITPWYAKAMLEHEAAGRLTTHLGVEVRDVVAVDSSSSSSGGGEKMFQVVSHPHRKDIPPTHHVYFATGPAAFEHHAEGHRTTATDQRAPWVPPHLRTMQRAFPIDWVPLEAAAVPAIRKDMSWDEGIPLYFTGPLGAINIGPTAATLGGANRGAEWCVRGIEKRFKRARI